MAGFFAKNLKDHHIRIRHQGIRFEIGRDRDGNGLASPQDDLPPNVAILFGLRESVALAQRHLNRHPPRAAVGQDRVDRPLAVGFSEFDLLETVYGDHYVEEPLLDERVIGRLIGRELAQDGDIVLKGRIVGSVPVSPNELAQPFKYRLAADVVHQHPGDPGTLVVDNTVIAGTSAVDFDHGAFGVDATPQGIALFPPPAKFHPPERSLDLFR